MDDEILQLVRDGRREEAIARLLPAHRDRVFALIYSIVGQRDWAEDLAQEVFVKIWRALPAFDGRSALSTWIHAIARNAAISALRTRRKSSSLSDEAVAAEVEQRVVQEDSAVDPDAARIDGWVAQLPPREQQVVRLYYLRECSVEEVGALLGMPAGTVKTLLHRGRERLRVISGVAA